MILDPACHSEEIHRAGIRKIPVLRVKHDIYLLDRAVCDGLDLHRRQKAGQPRKGRIGKVDEPVADVLGKMVQRDRQHLHTDGKRGRFKVLADGGAAILIENAGIVVRCVDLDGQIVLDKRQRIPHCSVHRAGAAEAQGILKGAGGVGLFQVGALQVIPAALRTHHLTGQAARRVDLLTQRLQAAVQAFKRQAERCVRGLEQLLHLIDQHNRRGFALRVGGNNGQSVLRTQNRPLEAFRLKRFRSGDDLSLVFDLSLSDQRLSDHGKGRDVPLSDRTATIHNGVDPAVQKLLIELQNSGRNARSAAQRRVQSDAEHRADLLHAAARENAKGVAVDEIPIILLEKVGIKLLVLVPADAAV